MTSSQLNLACGDRKPEVCCNMHNKCALVLEI